VRRECRENELEDLPLKGEIPEGAFWSRNFNRWDETRLDPLDRSVIALLFKIPIFPAWESLIRYYFLRVSWRTKNAIKTARISLAQTWDKAAHAFVHVRENLSDEIANSIGRVIMKEWHEAIAMVVFAISLPFDEGQLDSLGRNDVSDSASAHRNRSTT
jgi:hypothetical protein